MKLIDLLEALPISTVRYYRSKWSPDAYKDFFEKFPDKDKKAFRVYFPLPEGGEAPIGKSTETPSDIRYALRDKGYRVEDYRNGIAVKISDDKRKVRIGKLLADNPVLKKMFDEDPNRVNAKKTNLFVVISRHPYDVAAMSTDRGWTSCMDLKDGSNMHYVYHDVVNGTLVAYIIEANDRNIQHPIARLLIKPFINEETGEVILYPESKQYGTATAGFGDVVQKFCDRYNGDKGKGLYCLNRNLYNDFGVGRTLHKIEDMSDDELEILLKDDKIKIKDIPNPSERVQMTAVRLGLYNFQQIKNPSEKVQLYAVSQLGGLIRHIKNPSPAVQLEAVKDDPMSIEYIKNPTPEVQILAVKTIWSAIRNIVNPTEETQLTAIKIFPNAINYINGPTKKAIELAKSLDAKYTSDDELLDQLRS